MAAVKPLPDDPTERQRLAADPMASVWVSASAGTGKTKVLTDRVLGLLVTQPSLEPQKVLCLTFTRAAAAEMETRIADRLGLWAMADEDDLKEKLRDLLGTPPTDTQIDRARHLFALVLDTPGGMNIQTIHAFCQSLLRRFPLEAGIAPHFTLLDERDAGEILIEAEDELLSRARADGDGPLATALADATRYITDSDRFTSLIAALARSRGRLRRLIDGAGGLSKLADRVRGDLGLEIGETPETIIAAASEESAFDQLGLRLAIEALNNGTDSDKARAAIIADWLANSAPGPAAFDTYGEAYLTQNRTIRKTLITKAAAKDAPGVQEILTSEGERVARVYSRIQAAVVAKCTEAILTLGETLVGGYQARKDRRGFLDYDDLISGAGDLLNRPGVAPWVLFKLDGGIDHILIDEAQDTSPDQWRVVEAIANEFFAGAGTHETRRTIFAVGDVKQSIYSFQGADPKSFQKMRNLFGEQVPAAKEIWRDVDLNVSFRSAPAVLAAVDAVFADDAARDGVALDPNPIEHRASRSGAAGLVELWTPVEPRASDEPPPWKPPVERIEGDVPQSRLARLIAGRIAKMIGGEEILESQGRPIRAGDIMVLVRRRTGFVDDLVRTLKKLKVGVAGVDRMVLTEQIAVMDLMALGRVALLPEDDLTLASVLKSPLIGLSEGELFELAYDRGASLWRALADAAKGKAVFAAAFEILAGARARVDKVQPYEFFNEALGGSIRGREKLLSRLGPDAEDPIAEFLNLALAFEAHHVPSMEGFLHWLTSSEVEIKRDLEHGAPDMVRVMTVHGAKGLQAPIVFLPDTMQMPTAAGPLLWPLGEDGRDRALLWPPRRAFYDPVSEAELERVKLRRDQEYRRLLYVAMTRAEDRLYISGWRTKVKEPEDCWYHLIRRALENIAGTEADAYLSNAAETISPDTLRLSSKQTDAVKTPPGEPEFAKEALPDWAFVPPPPDPDPLIPLTPSNPDGEEPAAASPLSGDDGLRFRRGTLVHALLQTLPDLNADARPAAAAAYLKRKVHKLDAAQQKEIAEETLAVLSHPEFGPLFGPGSLAEVPLVGRIGDRIISAQLDRISVTDNEVFIVDYKTNRPPPIKASDVPEIYLRQMSIYREALQKIYPDRTVRCLLMWTVGPSLMELPDQLLAPVTT
ncbi:MAG: double-strand break repair helicase AddA [Rhodospirillales bacterium]|nr:double-strand break repair helicase AddA [Rhodospirillales bacterium]